MRIGIDVYLERDANHHRHRMHHCQFQNLRDYYCDQKLTGLQSQIRDGEARSKA